MKNNGKEKIKFSSLTILVAIFMTIGFIAAGCFGGFSGSTASSGTGAFSMSVAWPNHGQKLIPANSNSISVSISGSGIPVNSPIITSISSGETTLTINNIPVGSKTAEIMALDASSNVTAVRMQSFTIITDHTTTTNNIPLGIAITGTTNNPVFEPSSINVNAGDVLYVQNWLSSDETVTGLGSNTSLPGIATDSNGFMTFSEMSGSVKRNLNLGINNSSNLAGIICKPVYDINDPHQWLPVGTPNVSVNNFMGMALDGNNTPYIAFSDLNNSNLISVMNFNGTSWQYVGNRGFSNQQPWFVSVAIDPSNTPYVSFADNGYLRVMKLNGTSWITSEVPEFRQGLYIPHHLHLTAAARRTFHFVIFIQEEITPAL